MFYSVFRSFITLVLKLFFRMEPPSDPHAALSLPGPVIYVGNHPNGMIDPGLMFVTIERRVTFLAKEPLFKIPLLGLILKGLGALPVFRKQDGANTTANEGTLTASVDALVQGRALTLFPEGKSHSEPKLAELKTGCARIALDAVRKGAAVTIVPIGLTYSAKNRFKSRVRIDVGAPIAAKTFVEAPGGDAYEAAKQLTEVIAEGLRAVTLNLHAWEDLPIIETAESLYALRQGDRSGNAERQRAFAKGLAIVREEQPERFEVMKQQLSQYRERLELVRVRPNEVAVSYNVVTVLWFVVRNLIWLLGLPVFLLGMLVFLIPYWIPALVVKVTKPEDDIESTIKIAVLVLLAPFWWALLVVLAWWRAGVSGGLITFFSVPLLALFTRWYLERRSAAWRDARVFLLFWSRARLRNRLVTEGQSLSDEIERLVAELGSRVTTG